MSSPELPELAELLDGVDISGRRGAPFDAGDVASACAEVRGECAWHIAPTARTEQLISGPAGPRLVLRSLRVLEVHEIVEVPTGRPVTGWRAGTAGMLVRDAGWPRGEDNLRVTLTHGFDVCPADLLGVVLARVRELASAVPAGARSFSRVVGGVTTTTVADGRATPWSPAAAAVLERYRT